MGAGGKKQSSPPSHLISSFSLSCSQARELLDNLGAQYHVVELDRAPQGFALKKELAKVRGRGWREREGTHATHHPRSHHFLSLSTIFSPPFYSQMTGRSSVPSIFVEGRHLGGCYDGPGIVPLYRTGELQRVLKAARAL